MKFEYTGRQVYGTRWYKVIAEEGEILTNQNIDDAIPMDIAPWGFRVECNNGKEAVIAGYVD